MEPLFSGTVKAGKFMPDDPARYAGRLARLEGKRVQLSVRRAQTGRTLTQNRYYWGVVLATLSEWSGHTPEELHGYLKDALLPSKQMQLPNGTVMTIPGSTASLTVEDFARYVDQTVQWAAHQGVNIPSPDEVTA